MLIVLHYDCTYIAHITAYWMVMLRKLFGFPIRSLL